jgi:hypothetical protein
MEGAGGPGGWLAGDSSSEFAWESSEDGSASWPSSSGDVLSEARRGSVDRADGVPPPGIFAGLSGHGTFNPVPAAGGMSQSADVGAVAVLPPQPTVPPPVRTDQDQGSSGEQKPKRQRSAAAALAQPNPSVGATRDFDEDGLPRVSLAGQLLSSAATDQLDKETVYGLLSDPNQTAQGPRPDLVRPTHIGAVFLERQDSAPPSQFRSRAGRRPAGMEQWKTSDLSSIQQVPGVSFGADARGEVWIKKSYGKVTAPRKKPRPNAPTYSFNSYHLCYYRHGRGRDTPRSEAGKHADFIRGAIYHVIGMGAGASALSVQEGRQGSVPLDISLRSPSDPDWLRFADASGAVKGSVYLRDDKLTLGSRGGDFAEFHKRAPCEPPFEEGDLVAFGPRGLTRETRGAQKLGVISRRAVITGTTPDKCEVDDYDTVAYVGLVPAKIRGQVTANDFLAPSGKADGTAVAMSRRPRASVGRVCDLDSAWSRHCCCHKKSVAVGMVTIAVFNPAETVRDDLKSHSRLKVECYVRRLLLVIIAAWLAYMYYCLFFSVVCAPISLEHGTVTGNCAGRYASTCVYDQCDAGYTMVSQHAADPSSDRLTDYSTKIATMAERTKHCEPTLIAALFPPRDQGPTDYIGTVMRCVKSECPVETIRPACLLCAGKDALVTFPSTKVLHEREVVVVSCPPGFSGNVSRRCDRAGWSVAEGQCQRLQCPRHHILLAGGPAGVTPEQQEQCYHLGLNSSSVNSSTSSKSDPDAYFCNKLRYHSLAFDETPEDSGRRTLACPHPQYRGSVSASCEANSSTWENWTGTCTHRVCPAEWTDLKLCANGMVCNRTSGGVTGIVPVHLPQQEVSSTPHALPTMDMSRLFSLARTRPSELWNVVPCCRQFSSTGSCVDEQFGFGYVITRCSERGEAGQVHQAWDSKSSDWVDSLTLSESLDQVGCHLPSDIVDGVRMDKSLADGSILYRRLAAMMNDRYAKHQTSWKLPSNGVLSSISVSIAGRPGGSDWRPITAVPRTATMTCLDPQHDATRYLDTFDDARCQGEASIDTGRFRGANPPGYTTQSQLDIRHEFGRPAAAFADVSCRQHGFKRATLVTTCRALFETRSWAAPSDMSQEDATWWKAKQAVDSDTDLFLELCPEFRDNVPVNLDSLSRMMCDSWLDVSDQPMSQSHEWEEWVRTLAYNRSALNPTPSRSSCSGAESDIRQCFVAQVHHMLQQAAGQTNTANEIEVHGFSRPCKSKIIVGCTDEHSAVDADGDAGARKDEVPVVSPNEGVWAFGDNLEFGEANVNVMGNALSPKIFTHFDGPYNCLTGKRVEFVATNATNDRDSWVNMQVLDNSAADWCWGKLLSPGSAEYFDLRRDKNS